MEKTPAADKKRPADKRKTRVVLPEMSETSPREIVRRAVTFSCPPRIPRQLWLLPWAEWHYPDAVKEIKRRFPSDIVNSGYTYEPSDRARGDAYEEGMYTDEWGCVFQNVQRGLIGEVKIPLVQDLSGWEMTSPPYEQIPKDKKRAYGEISRFQESTDRFVLASICPRPWERYQFLRGSENALMDIMDRDARFHKLLGLIHTFYMTELEFWAGSDVDGIMFMDDWGGQDRLLVPPPLWREIFKPLYRDYCVMGHACDKLMFMHSDGYITDIIPDLIDAGVDALNSQLFCMDMEELARKGKGKITFWGEIDRQHVLTSPDPETGREAVRRVAGHFYDPRGGVIAQFEFGPGTRPGTAFAVFEEWERIGKG